MHFRRYREFFRALANQTRFQIVQRLRERPYYVGELVEALGIEQSRVSHNLACLLNCGFVEWEWQGKNKVYRLHPDLVPLLAAIDKHLSRYAPALGRCSVLAAEANPVVIVPRSERNSIRRRRQNRNFYGVKK